MRTQIRSLSLRGFTLIELMVAIAVLAIILVLAVPGFRQLMESQRLRAAVFDMVTDLTLARSEALKRGKDVTLKPITVGSWTNGWQIFVGTEEVSKRSPVGGGVAFVSAPGSVVFESSGRVSSSTATVKFGLKTSDASRQRCILLDPSGRAKSISSACPT